MIDGVQTKELKLNSDERGWLVEVLRGDWNFFEKFGQVYVTTSYPKVVKAWHMHKLQTDCMTCVKGKVKFVLYDGRDGSKTKGEICEVKMDEKTPILIKIPPGVWHGFKNIGNDLVIVINAPTELYNYENPDEYRLPPDTNRIPYNWVLDPKVKHG